MLEILRSKKEEKLKEIRELEAQIELEENKEFQHLVGKYMKLASTCVIRIDRISYCDNHFVHIDGLKVTCSGDGLDIELGGDEGFPKGARFQFITKSEFLEFMQKSIDTTIENVKHTIGND